LTGWPVSRVTHDAWQGLEVWRIALDEVDATLLDAGALSRFEQARAQRFRYPADRHRYLAAHVGLRWLLSPSLGLPPEAIQLHETDQGKPCLAHPDAPGFSLSHSQGLAVVAWSAHRDIGVDVELRRPLPELPALAQNHLTSSEHADWRALPPADQAWAFLRLWTRKEAALKALGTGLLVEPVAVETGHCDRHTRWRPQVDGRGGEVEILPSLDGGDWVVSVARHWASPLPIEGTLGS